MSTYVFILRRYTVLSQTLLLCTLTGYQANHLRQGDTIIFLAQRVYPGVRYPHPYDFPNRMHRNYLRDNVIQVYERSQQ